ncbi:uncharacterized protein [Mytilus edulis]|uniref:uncharacterized protein n=1 Tax=Mytilus edulis TaxID=6550 RepID=UPI0039F010B6
MATVNVLDQERIFKGTTYKAAAADDESDYIQEFVFTPETFQSVFISQQSIKQFEDYRELIDPGEEHFKEWDAVGNVVESIFADPHLIIASQGRHFDDIEFIKDKRCHLLRIGKDYLGFQKLSHRPYAVVFLIQISKLGGEIRISHQDANLMETLKKLQPAYDSVVYVIQNSQHKYNYTTNDLLTISTEIEKVFKLEKNSAYKSTFFETDVEWFIRVGLIMQNHILTGMKSLQDILEKVNKQHEYSHPHVMQTRASKKLKNGKTRHVQSPPCTNQKTALQNILIEEMNKITFNVALHVWKILSFRNSSIQAFGFVKGVVRIYLKDISMEADAMKYFKKFFKTNSLHVTMQVWPSNRQMTKYSFEQGSRIDVSNVPLAKNEEIKYGTLGMFLENRKKDLFFTTCAHVIEKGKYAFCPKDHSILGESVFTCEGPSSTSKQWLDLSLVKVHNSKIHECRFGLKGDSDCSHLSEYTIFPGFLDDIRSRPVYKWGARTNYTKGTIDDFVISKDESDQKYFLEIRVSGCGKFALPSDSGSLICMNYPSRNDSDPTAAFVIIGAFQIPVEDQKITMLCCYSVLDAIEEIRTCGTIGEGIQPCAVIRQSRRIASVSGCNPDLKTSVKRQKMLPPRK